MAILKFGSFAGVGPVADKDILEAYRTGNQEERPGTVWLDGVGVATIQLERKNPVTGTWTTLSAAGFPLFVWSYTGTPISEDFAGVVDGVDYRLNCTSYTSGAVAWAVQS